MFRWQHLLLAVALLVCNEYMFPGAPCIASAESSQLATAWASAGAGPSQSAPSHMMSCR